MTNTLTHTGAASGAVFEPLPGKNGRVSTMAERQAGALNALSRAALLGVALGRRSAMQKRAAAVFAKDAVTLADYAAAAAESIAIDGGRWGELRALLAAELGAGHLTAERGRAGCAELCRVARLAAERRYLMADTVKASAAALRKLDSIDAWASMVERLTELHDAARIAAEAAQENAQNASERVNAVAEA